jgi:hypothetical protein
VKVFTHPRYDELCNIWVDPIPGTRLFDCVVERWRFFGRGVNCCILFSIMQEIEMLLVDGLIQGV